MLWQSAQKSCVWHVAQDASRPPTLVSSLCSFRKLPVRWSDGMSNATCVWHDSQMLEAFRSLWHVLQVAIDGIFAGPACSAFSSP